MTVGTAGATAEGRLFAVTDNDISFALSRLESYQTEI